MKRLIKGSAYYSKSCLLDTEVGGGGAFAEVGNEGNDLFSCLFVTSERFEAVTRMDAFVNSSISMREQKFNQKL